LCFWFTYDFRLGFIVVEYRFVFYEVFDKKGRLIWFPGLVFCWGMIFVKVLGLWWLNVFVSSVYGAEKDGLCAHFESVFLLNEWWVGVLVGFSWIVCCYELVVLYKCLKVWTFMVAKGISVHSGQCNELLICRTWCKPS